MKPAANVPSERRIATIAENNTTILLPDAIPGRILFSQCSGYRRTGGGRSVSGAASAFPGGENSDFFLQNFVY